MCIVIQDSGQVQFRILLIRFLGGLKNIEIQTTCIFCCHHIVIYCILYHIKMVHALVQTEKC